MITETSELQIVKTKEGTDTLYSPQVGEHYHSLFGSLQEAMHTFIKNGFRKAAKHLDNLRIFEMGFGTGLNAILTWRENQVLQKQIHYTTIEAFPVHPAIASRLNYFEYFAKPLQPVFREMHQCEWFTNVQLGNFQFRKVHIDMLDYHFDDSYNLVYYDAFSPDKQNELWQMEIFQKVYDASNPEAILVTYCANGNVRRALLAVGYKVEVIEGAVGKKQMIRAIKNLI